MKCFSTKKERVSGEQETGTAVRDLVVQKCCKKTSATHLSFSLLTLKFQILDYLMDELDRLAIFSSINAGPLNHIIVLLKFFLQ